MADIFNRNIPTLATPLTADRATLVWGGVVASVANLSLAVQQPVNIRHTIGNQKALVHTGMPQGSLQISRIVADDASALF